MSTATAAPTLNEPGDLKRAVWNTVRGSAGNLVEWFDVYTYTVFSSYFASQFFGNVKNSQVDSMAVFATTFVMRPVGSWFFGRWADRHGRKSALTFSVSLMALASFLIALLPTRQAVGFTAVILLVFCRLVQGFATGGEYGTSATYMSEAATRRSRGFLSSFQYVTLVGGQVLATFVLLILQFTLTEAQIKDFGWRIPFAIGGLAAIVVFWLRRTMDESLTDETLADIKSGQDHRSGSMAELLTRYWKPLLLVFLLTMGGTMCFYTFSVNGPAMIKTAFKAHPQTATWINLGCLIVLMLLQPVGGLISDKIGRKPLLVWFGCGALVYVYFFVTYLPTQKSVVPAVGMMLLSYVFLVGYTSINALVKAEQFPSHIRALGVGLGYGLANALFGGTAPMVYEWATVNKHVDLFIAYISAGVLISLLVYVFWLKNKGDTHLDLEQGHAYR